MSPKNIELYPKGIHLIAPKKLCVVNVITLEILLIRSLHCNLRIPLTIARQIDVALMDCLKAHFFKKMVSAYMRVILARAFACVCMRGVHE